MFGLKDRHIKLIQSVFSSYSSVDNAVIYGSRAKGNYSTGSDIDLTLKGDDINLSTLLKIENELDDLLLPYKIDLSIFHKIEDPERTKFSHNFRAMEEITLKIEELLNKLNRNELIQLNRPI